MRILFKPIASFTLLLLLFSCSSKPAESEAKELLALQIELGSNGTLSLAKFNKTNSVDGEFFGQRTHTIEFEAKINVEKDCFMFVDPTGMGPYFFEPFTTYDKKPEMTPGPFIQILSCKKGEKLDYSGSTTYYDTEKGWVIK